MDRRLFLKSAGVLFGAVGAPSVLAACGSGGSSGIPEGEAQLNPVIATYEVLIGGPRQVLFGLRTLDNVEVPEAEVTVFLRDEAGDEMLAGPLQTEYVVAPGTQLGLYRVEVEFDEPGTPELVAVEGDRYGATALRVVTPESSQAPVPGTAATAVATPTDTEKAGYERICTQDPPCGMHEVSLDEAVDGGRPVMLVFATPEFCQTAVCGPVVETADKVRTGGQWGDTAWIHVEIYSKVSGGQRVLGEPVKQWNLPTEPWLFSIDSSGKIADRLDGPMVEDDVARLATSITA